MANRSTSVALAQNASTPASEIGVYTSSQSAASKRSQRSCAGSHSPITFSRATGCSMPKTDRHHTKTHPMPEPLSVQTRPRSHSFTSSEEHREACVSKDEAIEVEIANHCRFSRGLMVRDARRRAPHHEGLSPRGLRPHPEEHRAAMRLEG